MREATCRRPQPPLAAKFLRQSVTSAVGPFPIARATTGKTSRLTINLPVSRQAFLIQLTPKSVLTRTFCVSFQGHLEGLTTPGGIGPREHFSGWERGWFELLVRCLPVSSSQVIHAAHKVAARIDPTKEPPVFQDHVCVVEPTRGVRHRGRYKRHSR